MDMLEARRELEESISKGKPAPSSEGLPKALHLQHIREKRALFQHRTPQAFASEAHVKELSKAPLAGNTLDALTVFWDGSGWVLIDGHHRLAAYRKAGWSKEIPVRCFPGTLDQAIGHAGKANAGAKLMMSRSEKQGTAWRLVCCTKLSRAATVASSCVSDGVVAEMRRVRDRLMIGLGRPLDEVAALTWWQAQREAAGSTQEAEMIDLEAHIEKEAQDIANKLVKALGKSQQLRRGVLARALEIYDGSLQGYLREQWGDGEPDEGLGDDPDQPRNPDF